jgi:hypothetical protein
MPRVRVEVAHVGVQSSPEQLEKDWKIRTRLTAFATAYSFIHDRRSVASTGKRNSHRIGGDRQVPRLVCCWSVRSRTPRHGLRVTDMIAAKRTQLCGRLLFHLWRSLETAAEI